MKSSRLPLVVVAALSVLAIGVLSISGCKPESATSSGGGGGGGAGDDGWAGQTRVESIFSESCSGCHASQFASCWNVQDNASEIESAVASGSMPRSGVLPSSDKAALLQWLQVGAPCSGTRPKGSGAGGGGIIGGDTPGGF